MNVSSESWAVLAIVLGAFGVTLVRVAVKVLRNARTAQLAERAELAVEVEPGPATTPRDEFRELRAQPHGAEYAGTHIIEGELRDVDHAELVRELREAGWVDAPYLDVRGGVVRELVGGRYCPHHGVDLVPPDRTPQTRRYCPKCPEGSPFGFPSQTD